MKPVLSLLTTTSFCLIFNFLVAQPIDINTAKMVAEHHLVSINQLKLKSAGSNVKNFQCNSVKAAVENNDTLYYILNDTIYKGFVIVSADKRAWPILGYSTEGSFNEKRQPDAFVAWMDSKKKEIEFIKKNSLRADSATEASWQKLTLKAEAVSTQSVEPLLKTKWGQGCFYNEKCPSDSRSGFCGHVPTGCVATAMAQIMKYWNYPTNGKGSNSYPCFEYGTISADFGATSYQWDQMPNSLTGSNEAVATLMYHCGVAAGMGYGPWESGTNLLPNVLTDFFDYSSNVRLVNSKDYTSDEWAKLLMSELDFGHPIFYSTSLPGGGTHALVCDGYQGSDFFHFNWGWDGASDGYYYLGKLNPDSQLLDKAQKAIIRITPSHLPEGYKGLILSTNNLVINSNEGNLNPISVTIAASANWSVACNQPWITLNTTSGKAGTTNLLISVSENVTNDDRSAQITITAEGFPPQLINIKQVHKHQLTAGGLQNILGNELSTITNLTLKGFIDARDFKTMRDLMLSLESVDLSETTILSYAGSNGTAIGDKYYPANTIPEDAFVFSSRGECSRLTTFVFPSTATSIGNRAFNSCFNLANLTIPSTIQSFGNNVFDNCISLRKIFIPSSVSNIGHQIYYNGTIVSVDPTNPNYMTVEDVLYNKAKTLLIYCPNTKVGNFEIPESVNKIGYCAFKNCINITSFTIPQSVNSIGTWAFGGCFSLRAISIPPSVNVMEEAPFFGCDKLNSIKLGNSVPIDLRGHDGVFTSIDKDKCTLNVPYKTAALYRAAYQWGDFKNIVETSNGFSLSATDVKLAAEANSSTTVSVKSNVAWSVSSDQSWLSVSPVSGSGDDKLTLVAQEKTSEGSRSAKITVSANGFENQFVIVKQDGAAIKITAGNLVNIFTAEELESITVLKLTGTIDARDFKTMRDKMPRLTSIDLSNSIIVAYNGREGTSIRNNTYYPANTIPEFAFASDYSIGKTNLASFIFPASTKSIDDYAFCNCWGLTILSLPASLQNIGFCAFAVCKNLTSIFVPSSVTTISVQAFEGCSALYNVDNGNPNYSSFDGVLYNKNKTNLIQCPISKTGSFIIPETVTTIGREAFYFCPNITSVIIPSSVNQIQWLAFGLCKNLSSLIVRRLVPAVLYSSDDPFWLVDKNTCTLYVPHGSKVAYQTANQWKDFKNIVEMPDLTLSAMEARVSAKGNSTTSVSLKGNAAWTAVSDQPWLTVDFASGNGDKTLTFTAQENESAELRTARITVLANNIPQTIVVTQEGRIVTGIDIQPNMTVFLVYPNPTSGNIKLVFDQVPPEGIWVTVDAMNGKSCLKRLIFEQEVWLDLYGNVPGIYFVKTNQKNSRAQKLILQ